MSIKEGEQVLSKTDIGILNFLKDKNEPIKKTDLHKHMKKTYNKKSNRVNDRLKKLKEILLIKETEGEKKGSKVLQIISQERNFVKRLINKFG